jgi:hypothetical protein
LNVLAIAIVLGRQERILATQVADLLAEPLADVSLLSEGIGDPYGQDQNHRDHDGAT